jgi:hypothetical protein
MKALHLSALLVFALLALSACLASSTPAPDLDATVQAAVQSTLDAQPTDTPAPDMQATLVAAVEATLTAQPASPSSDSPEVASAGERLHRSYPAPTGYPGFRKYYQKRCYPGCHYDATEGTPTPQAVHP